MNLPNKEKTFDFECVGETTGKTYDGRFTVLCVLNIGQKHALALEKTRLLGSYSNPTDDLVGYALILSSLRIKVVDGPEWWKQSRGGLVVDDEEPLVKLYQKIQEVEEEWKKDLKEKAEKLQQAPTP